METLDKKKHTQNPHRKLFEGFLEYTSASIRKIYKGHNSCLGKWKKGLSTFSAGNYTGIKMLLPNRNHTKLKAGNIFFRHRGCLYRAVWLYPLWSISNSNKYTLVPITSYCTELLVASLLSSQTG